MNRDVKMQLGIERQLLHASRLEFAHPVTKKRLHIEAPIPEDMGKFIEKFLK